MPLKLMYITNNPEVARIAEKNGVDRVWIDLETMGKEERQRNINSVKSRHTIHDIEVVSKVLKTSEMLVRVNAWNQSSVDEIEQVITAGADRIMLPMWRNPGEVTSFLTAINGRVKNTLLLETKEAVECLDEVLKNPLVEEIHIGLNDLHLSYGLDFMFELLSNGMVEALCNKIRKAGIPYGFGGIARIGGGMLPAEKIIMEHYRLGSTRAILSRSFCNTEEINDISRVSDIFTENMTELIDFEKSLCRAGKVDFENNRVLVCESVAEIVSKITGKKANG